jgi:ABC-2 type transport system permease protein
MHHAWLICLKDLRQRMRDRTALIVAVVAPLALTALIGMALGGAQGFRMRLGIADLDGSPVSHELVDFVQRPWLKGIIEVRPIASRSAAQTAVERREVDCAVVIDRGFANATGDDKSKSIEILAVGNAQFALQATRALVQDFIQRVAAKRVDQPPIASVTPLSPGGALRMIDFFAASMTVLFLTFAVLSGVRALQSEVDSRTILRLMASPTEATAILAGKFAALVLIGLTQMSVMIAATSILFGTKWGNPLPVAAMVATSVLMAIGLTAFLMSLAKNAEQGTAMAALVISLLSIVGGQFLPPQGLPDVFETLARLTPNGQAFYGFVDLSAAGSRGSIATIMQPLLFTGIVGAAGIVFATFRARAALQRIA